MKGFFYFLSLFLSLLTTISSSDSIEHADLKLLHLTFHRGCEKEFEAVAKELGVEVETWFIPDLPKNYFDGTTSGNALYNMGHDRAERIWELHRDKFEQFDGIIVSDTAPLSRIFLQNGWKKPLIIWICNRFDYSDSASLDCHFPDPEYYELFDQACQAPHVTVIAYTKFERYYAQTKNIDIGDLTITPCAPYIQPTSLSSIPASIKKEEMFFLPPYHNEKNFINLSALLEQLGIPNYRGRYNGAYDLKDFKAIIHLPYSWSNLALFENISLGIPYFIPSQTFFETLARSGHYFHPSLSLLLDHRLYELSEWYDSDHQEAMTYFDSWDDLKQKIEKADFIKLREKTLHFAQKHKQTMLERWRSVFNSVSHHIKTLEEHYE